MNAVSPGVVKTKVTESLLKDLGKDEKSWTESHAMTDRLVTSDEVADPVAFLAATSGRALPGRFL